MTASIDTLGAFDLPHHGVSARLDAGELVSTVSATSNGASRVVVEAVINAPPSVVVDVLGDYEALPDAIVGLTSATIIATRDDKTDVRFAVKLPYPLGSMVWTNRLQRHTRGEAHTIAWDYLGGSLLDNTGRLVAIPYGTHRSYVRYEVTLQARSRLPKRAQRLLTGLLLPRVFKGLTRAVDEGMKRR